MMQPDIPNIEPKKKFLVQPIQTKDPMCTALGLYDLAKLIQRNLNFIFFLTKHPSHLQK
uniref:Uncharacterized protein n=1 Tax=Arundo donax TaxID=35708 RepID=A0A0A9BVM1_ARUDO